MRRTGKDALQAAGLVTTHVDEEVEQTERLISPATLDRWFALEPEGGRPSYAQHLLRHLAPQEVAEVQALFRRQLGSQVVTWQTRIAFVVAQRPPA